MLFLPLFLFQRTSKMWNDLKPHPMVLLSVNRSWKGLVCLQFKIIHQIVIWIFHCSVVYFKVSLSIFLLPMNIASHGESPVCIHYLIWMLWSSGFQLVFCYNTDGFHLSHSFTGVSPGLCRIPSKLLVSPPLSHLG